MVDTQLAKLTIVPFSDRQYTKLAGSPWLALFNPSELSFTRKNNYSQTASAGSSQPQTAYASGEPDEISLDLFFDGTGVVSDVPLRDRIEHLLSFGAFQSDTHQPYYLHLYWGPLNFRGVLLQADIKYTMFNRVGEPLRATVTTKFQEALAPEEVTAEERRESPDLYQTWEVREGENLDSIALDVYGSVDYWRPIAAANDLTNPRRLMPGQRLVLPPKA